MKIWMLFYDGEFVAFWKQRPTRECLRDMIFADSNKWNMWFDEEETELTAFNLLEERENNNAYHLDVVEENVLYE
jgi:arsenate reductase-like glutaredoxin family protein